MLDDEAELTDQTDTDGEEEEEEMDEEDIINGGFEEDEKTKEVNAFDEHFSMTLWDGCILSCQYSLFSVVQIDVELFIWP